MNDLDISKSKKKVSIKTTITLVILGLLSIAIFGLLSTAVFFYNTESDDISKLEMEQANIPRYWSCEWIQQPYPLNWELNVVDNERWYEYYEYYLETSSEKIMAYQWVENSDYGGSIDLAIADYRTRFIAKNKYRNLDPSLRFSRYYENFGEKDGGIVAFHDRRMDEDAIQCGSGSLEMCNRWFYRARKGQYYIFIEEPGPLCLESFKEIVISINNQFFKNIQ